MEAQTIFRRAKGIENPYVMISNTIFTDGRLSWKAKGLLGYLLSRPDDWIVRMHDLISQSTDGASAVHTALAELKTAGYLVQRREQELNGQFSWVYEIHEFPEIVEPVAVPVTPEPEPSIEKPCMAYPQMENRMLLSTELPSTDLPKEHASAKSASASSKKEKAKGNGKTALAMPVAVAQFRAVTRRTPRHELWDDIARTVGDKPADLDFWSQVITRWNGCGWNPMNVDGMLECFRKRQLPSTAPGNGKGNGHGAPAPSPDDEMTPAEKRTLARMEAGEVPDWMR